MADQVAPVRERNVPLWFGALAALAVIWSFVNASQGDPNNAAQHGLLAGIFGVCGLIAWFRDRKVDKATRQAGLADTASNLR